MQGARRRRVADSLHLAVEDRVRGSRVECGFRDRMRPQSLTRRRTGWSAVAAAVGRARSGPPAPARRRRRATAAAVGEGLVPGRRSRRHAARRPGRRHDGGDRQHHEADDRLRGLGTSCRFPSGWWRRPTTRFRASRCSGSRQASGSRYATCSMACCLPSGNDAAVALADGVAGSVPAFVGEMNRAAGRLGLRDTSYANPIGLDEPGNYSTPRDLATLTMRLRRERLFRRIFDTAADDASDRRPSAHDRQPQRPGVDGSMDRRREDRLHARRRLRADRLRHPQGRHPALGRAGRSQRGRPRRRTPCRFWTMASRSTCAGPR